MWDSHCVLVFLIYTKHKNKWWNLGVTQYPHFSSLKLCKYFETPHLSPRVASIPPIEQKPITIGLSICKYLPPLIIACMCVYVCVCAGVCVCVCVCAWGGVGWWSYWIFWKFWLPILFNNDTPHYLPTYLTFTPPLHDFQPLMHSVVLLVVQFYWATLKKSIKINCVRMNLRL